MAKQPTKESVLAASKTKGLSAEQSANLVKFAGTLGRTVRDKSEKENDILSRTSADVARITGSDITDNFVSRQREEEKNINRYYDQRRQAILDAIRSSTAGREANIRREGEENLASQRSVNLRAGLGGSDFGAAAKAETRGRTNERLDLLEQERIMLVEQALGNIEQAQTSALQAKSTQLATEEATERARRSAGVEQAISAVTSLGQAGFDLQTIKERDPDLYNTVRSLTGKGDLELESLLNNAKPAAEKVDYQFKTVGSKVIAYGIDPNTGKIVSMEQDVGVNFDSTTSGGYGVSFAPDGTMLLIPKNFSGNPDEIIIGGGFGKADSGEARASANRVLSQLTGSDGKVSPDTFKEARSIWVEEYKLPADQFNEEFSSYINFNDPSWNNNYGVSLDLLNR